MAASTTVSTLSAWVCDEFQGVDLGDKRLNSRLVSIVSTLFAKPNLSIPAACSGRAEQEATYRFFDNAEVTHEEVLRPHIESTLKRAAQYKTILLVQDTTQIDLARPEQIVEGAGEHGGSNDSWPQGEGEDGQKK